MSSVPVCQQHSQLTRRLSLSTHCRMMMRPKDLRQGSGTRTFLDAMHGGKFHLARFILDALDGRIINSKTENSRTPLMYAVYLQDLGTRAKFTRLLLEKGADVNCQDEDGRTALSHACELGHLDVVKILVQFNADPDISDAWGNSSLMYAAFSGQSQVLEFLIRAFKRLGLRLDKTNNAGHSAIDVANLFGYNQCVQILNFPCKKGMSTDDPLADGGSIEDDVHQVPNRLPKHVLEGFSERFNSSEDQLPRMFHRQMKTGDSRGMWNPFMCPKGLTQEDNHHHSWALRPPLEKSQSEDDHSIFFAAKQLQNCQLSELRGNQSPNSLPEPSQKDVTGHLEHQQTTPECFPLFGRAKSFNIDILSRRKQSYQGDVYDMGLSASKLKRASLQDERCLIDKTECHVNSPELTNDADRTVSLPKTLLNSKTQTTRALRENVKSNKKEVNDMSQSGKKRESFGLTGRHKLLLARGEMMSGKIPSHAPGLVGLGTRLLRRFTAPEFMKIVKDCSSSSTSGRGRMSRSETFPLSHTHQEVNSQPSVDSISGVKCEFESCSSQSTLD